MDAQPFRLARAEAVHQAVQVVIVAGSVTYDSRHRPRRATGTTGRQVLGCYPVVLLIVPVLPAGQKARSAVSRLDSRCSCGPWVGCFSARILLLAVLLVG